jgi:hypothetical protein
MPKTRLLIQVVVVAVAMLTGFAMRSVASTPQVVPTGCLVSTDVSACSVPGTSVACGASWCEHEVLASEPLGRCRRTASSSVGFRSCELDTSRVAALCHMRQAKCNALGQCAWNGTIYFRYFIHERAAGDPCE